MRNFSKFDWNGDGKIDHWDDVYELSMIMQMTEDQAREDRIQTLEQAIVRSGLSQIGNEEFAALCYENHVRMEDFEQSDIDELQRRLNRY